MPTDEKVGIVEELREDIKESQALLLTDYRGLNVKKLTELRRKLREVDAEYKVVKNTLFRRASSDDPAMELGEMLEGPTAVVFVHNDPVASAKALADFIKENKLPAVKGGYLEGQVLDAARVSALSKIPPKPVLQAQLLGSLQSPLSGLVGTLQAVISDLVYTLQAVADKKAA